MATWALLLPLALEDPCGLEDLRPAAQIPAALRAVLDSTQLVLREEVRWRHEGSGTCPTTATLMPGLARLCNYSAWAHYLVRPCIEGETTLTIALQAYGADARVFTDCEANIRQVVEGTRCSLLLVRAWLEPAPGAGDGMCGDYPPVRTVVNFVRRNPGTPEALALKLQADLPRRARRVAMQTIATGRAYAWARAAFPASRVFVRARMDSAWAVPSVPSSFVGVIFDTNGFVDHWEGGRRFPGDMYVLLPAHLARGYFDSWRVYSKVDCRRACFAGAATAECHVYGIVLRCTGETPLASWTCEHLGGSNITAGGREGRLPWYRLSRKPFPFIVPVNASHVKKRRKPGSDRLVDAYAAELDVRRQAYSALGACLPGCLKPLRRIDDMSKARSQYASRSRNCSAGDWTSRACWLQSVDRDVASRLAGSAAARRAESRA